MYDVPSQQQHVAVTLRNLSLPFSTNLALEKMNADNVDRRRQEGMPIMAHDFSALISSSIQAKLHSTETAPEYEGTQI